MLVLSRKRSERIWVGDDIRITIVKLDRNQVRIGIEAPGDVAIVREEVLMGTPDPSRRPAPSQADLTAVGAG
jgi:carbon storage regulator